MALSFFFLSKIRMPSKLRQNAAITFVISRQNKSKKSFRQSFLSTILAYTRKNANKNVAFLNVLSVFSIKLERICRKVLWLKQRYFMSFADKTF